MDLESLKRTAEGEFLGRSHVVGIGVKGGKTSGLVFLLDEPSTQSENTIRGWAQGVGIAIEIKVVGRIRPAQSL
jgi:hypothetical protein